MRAFIIHGYLSYPGEAWLPWMKAELLKRGYDVALPAMPHPDRPGLAEWIDFVGNLVGEPDARTVMIGHSMGCLAILHYLCRLGRAGKAVGRTVLVAGGYPTGRAPASLPADHPLQPWFRAKLDAGRVKAAAGACTVILSDNDPYIPVAAAKALYESNLGARVVMETGKGHFNEDDKLTELPSALAAVLS